MSQKIEEHTTYAPLLALIDKVLQDREPWHLAAIKREFLRPITNEAFLVAVRPLLLAAEQTNCYFASDRNIYVAWRGPRDSIYRNLRATIVTHLLRQGMALETAVIMNYIHIESSGETLKAALQQEAQQALLANRGYELPPEQRVIRPNTLQDAHKAGQELSIFESTPEQVRLYREGKKQKLYRKHLYLLVVEDQRFSQKLLCEILRGARINNSNDSPIIEAVEEIRDAWKLFMKRSHDIIFIDLGLLDGSGHALARAVKELDPNAHIIIVTANNYEEEQEVARQNNVDAFIAKPFSRKQIMDCIDKYATTKRLAQGC